MAVKFERKQIHFVDVITISHCQDMLNTLLTPLRIPLWAHRSLKICQVTAECVAQCSAFANEI